jgi:hypothetical protein
MDASARSPLRTMGPDLLQKRLVLSIKTAEGRLEIYQTDRKVAAGLVAYYDGFKEIQALIELGRCLAIVTEQLVGEIITNELSLSDQPIPEHLRLVFKMEPSEE